MPTTAMVSSSTSGSSTAGAALGGDSVAAPRLSPPSARITWPVTHAASSEARNATTRANSAGVPSLPKGVDRSMTRCMAAASGNWSATSLTSIAADAVLTLIPSGANSTAR